MEPISILYADSLDLLFENRNKMYGAYPLRKYYPRRLFTAMGLVSGVVLIFTVLISISNKHTGSLPVFVPPDVHIIDLTPDTKIPLQPVAPRPPASIRRVATIEYIAPVITRREPEVKPMASTEDLREKAIGVQDLAGPPASGETGDHAGMNGGAGTPGKDSAASKPEILEHADFMPEFPGGLEALRRYLLKNLRMPDTELEPGTQIQVLARFVVAADGKVADVGVTHSGGIVFDREVQRVIAKMPAWKPGMQHQQKVAVYFYLPVSFVIPAAD